MLYEPSAVRTLWTLFILTWTSQLSLDSLCLFLSLKTSLFLLSFLSYITSSIYQAMNVSSNIYTSSLQYPAPLVFLILLFVSRMARGVLELKSSVIVNKLEIAANICSTWQNGLTQHLPQKSTVPDGRGPFPESRIWFMTGCNWVLNRGNLNFIFQVSSWKHLLSHLQVTSPTFPLNVELKPVSLVPREGMTSLFCVGGLL